MATSATDYNETLVSCSQQDGHVVCEYDGDDDVLERVAEQSVAIVHTDGASSSGGGSEAEVEALADEEEELSEEAVDGAGSDEEVACSILLDNTVTGVTYNGTPLEVAGDANNWHVPKTVKFRDRGAGAALVVTGRDQEAGNSGHQASAAFAIQCASSDPRWDKLSASDLRWTARGSVGAGGDGPSDPEGGWGSYGVPRTSTSGAYLEGNRSSPKIWAPQGERWAQFSIDPHESDPPTTDLACKADFNTASPCCDQPGDEAVAAADRCPPTSPHCMGYVRDVRKGRCTSSPDDSGPECAGRSFDDTKAGTCESIGADASRCASTTDASGYLCRVDQRPAFAKTANAQIGGGDLRQLTGTSVEGCTRECAGEAGCAAFVFQPSSKTCWLKGVAEGAQAANGLDLYLRERSCVRGDALCPDLLPSFSPSLENVDVGGPDIRAQVVESEAQCKAACEGEAGCVAYGYAPAAKSCALKQALGEYKRAPGTFSAVRVPPGAPLQNTQCDIAFSGKGTIRGVSYGKPGEEAPLEVSESGGVASVRFSDRGLGHALSYDVDHDGPCHLAQGLPTALKCYTIDPEAQAPVRQARMWDRVDSRSAALSVSERSAPAYVGTPDADVAGSNIRSLTNTTRAACQSECDKDERCKALVFSSSSGSCWLKSSASLTANPGRHLTAFTRGYAPTADKDIAGSNILSMKNASADACRDACDAREDCKAVVHQSSSKSCWLKNSDRLVDNPGRGLTAYAKARTAAADAPTGAGEAPNRRVLFEDTPEGAPQLPRVPTNADGTVYTCPQTDASKVRYSIDPYAAASRRGDPDRAGVVVTTDTDPAMNRKLFSERADPATIGRCLADCGSLGYAYAGVVKPNNSSTMSCYCDSSLHRSSRKGGGGMDYGQEGDMVVYALHADRRRDGPRGAEGEQVRYRHLGRFNEPADKPAMRFGPGRSKQVASPEECQAHCESDSFFSMKGDVCRCENDLHVATRNGEAPKFTVDATGTGANQTGAAGRQEADLYVNASKKPSGIEAVAIGSFKDSASAPRMRKRPPPSDYQEGSGQAACEAACSGYAFWGLQDGGKSCFCENDLAYATSAGLSDPAQPGACGPGGAANCTTIYTRSARHTDLRSHVRGFKSSQGWLDENGPKRVGAEIGVGRCQEICGAYPFFAVGRAMGADSCQCFGDSLGVGKQDLSGFDADRSGCGKGGKTYYHFTGNWDRYKSISSSTASKCEAACEGEEQCEAYLMGGNTCYLWKRKSDMATAEAWCESGSGHTWYGKLKKHVPFANRHEGSEVEGVPKDRCSAEMDGADGCADLYVNRSLVPSDERWRNLGKVGVENASNYFKLKNLPGRSLASCRATCTNLVTCTGFEYDSGEKACSGFLSRDLKVKDKPDSTVEVLGEPAYEAYLEGIRSPGNDLRKLKAEPMICLEECSDDPQCKAVETDSATGECWLKSKLAPLVNDGGAQRWTAIKALSSDLAVECALEGGSCDDMGNRNPRTVRYGTDGKYKYKEGVLGQISCSNSVFGDPYPGRGKRCHNIFPGETNPEGFVKCGWEGETCEDHRNEDHEGPRKVRYGIEGKYVIKEFDGPIKCSNEAFGTDPYHGKRKECHNVL